MKEEQKTMTFEEHAQFVTDTVYKAQVKANEESLRDSFAHAALNALILLDEYDNTDKFICRDSYKIADYMLEARKG